MAKQEKLGEEMLKVRDEVKRLRDEIRVKLHLGAMDARDAFAAVEREVDAVGHEVTQASRQVLDTALTKLKAINAKFREEGKRS